MALLRATRFLLVFAVYAQPLRTHARLLGLLGSVLAATAHAVADTAEIEGAADQMVAHTGTILTAAASHQHDAMLLDVVALAGDVGRDVLAAAEAHTGRLSLA